MSAAWERVFAQEAFGRAVGDLEGGRLPGAVLFSGPERSGKFSAALELSRRLACACGGAEGCRCPSCLASARLECPDVLAVGPRACLLPIRAAARRLEGSPGDEESRTLFCRAVRSLTIRFTPLLWEGSDKLPKFAPLLSEVEDALSGVAADPAKAAAAAMKPCEKLEDFLYDSVPIDQVRAAVEWARIRPRSARKTLVVESAERMMEGSRNALLKVLEEPPEGVVFILTTANRGAMMQTILSRVRTYSFRARTESEEKDVLRAVFREESSASVAELLESFLPAKPSAVRAAAASYWAQVRSGGIPSAERVCAECASFSPRVLLREFLAALMEAGRDFSSASPSEVGVRVAAAARECWNSVAVYNQSPVAAVERLTRDVFLSVRLSR